MKGNGRAGWFFEENRAFRLLDGCRNVGGITRSCEATMRIDLNGDVGESFGRYTLGGDEALMPALTSANIACGFHAGDPGVMRATVDLARSHGVAIGAHPGFPDLVGFGRRALAASPREVEDLVLYQVGALAAIARAQGTRLRHVKPHGALYNQAASDLSLAEAVARAVAAFDPSLVLVGLSGSKLLEAGRHAGLGVAAEAFADRAYQSDGTLVPRDRPGAVLTDADTVAERALAMVRDRAVTAEDGARVELAIDTLCLHGDTPAAASLAGRVREVLAAAGVVLAAPERAS